MPNCIYLMDTTAAFSSTEEPWRQNVMKASNLSVNNTDSVKTTTRSGVDTHNAQVSSIQTTPRNGVVSSIQTTPRSRVVSSIQTTPRNVVVSSIWTTPRSGVVSSIWTTPRSGVVSSIQTTLRSGVVSSIQTTSRSIVDDVFYMLMNSQIHVSVSVSSI